MKRSASFFASALLSVALAPAAIADGLNPGSALVFPIHRSDVTASTYLTVVCVTNTNLNPATPANGLGGSTALHYEYVNTVPDLSSNANIHKPLHCNVVDRIEFLTPADTLCVLTSCHNAVAESEGYLVVSAQDPNKFNTPWGFNFLIGSEIVVDGGAIYTLNAIPFKAIVGQGEETDVDLDGQLDFDDVEYEGIADELYIDSFVGSLSGLILINMTGGFKHVANVAFDIWNDDEFPLSATLAFKCWTRATSLDSISLVFSEFFLANNTPNNGQELDTDCDGTENFNTGWARLRGLNASSNVESISDPAILGALIEGPYSMGGRRLWESEATQLNGDFFKTGSDDPEE